MGFTSEHALKYAKKASNHHQAMALINILQKGCWMELLIPYVRKRITRRQPLSVNDYLYNWANNREDKNYVYMFEQVNVFDCDKLVN